MNHQKQLKFPRHLSSDQVSELVTCFSDKCSLIKGPLEPRFLPTAANTFVSWVFPTRMLLGRLVVTLASFMPQQPKLFYFKEKEKEFRE
jgi:hypothetical protein